MEMKNVTYNPSAVWDPGEKLIVVGEIFQRGWYLVQRIMEKLSIMSERRVVLYL